MKCKPSNSRASPTTTWLISPPNLCDWNKRPVRVILLADEEGSRPAFSHAFKAISLKTRDFRFDRDDANAR